MSKTSRWWLAAAALTLLSACGEENPGFQDSGADATVFDATNDRVYPSSEVATFDVLGRVCTRSSQCDDGVRCTMDYCAADGRCVNLPDQGACNDNVFCNGVEQCDMRRGCVGGTPIACDDQYTCTLDRCDEATQMCQHVPRDLDRDGDPDIHCFGPACGDAGVPEPDGGLMTACWRGGDCDDGNPRVSSLLPEICGDGVDNNCNTLIDDMEPGGCTRPRYDRCDDALDISRGGRFALVTAGTMGDYPSRCLGGGTPMRDVVARLHLTEAHDVSVTASAMSTVVYLQFTTVCGSNTGSEVRDCVVAFPTVYRARALPAGDYFVQLGLTASTVASDIDLLVELSDPSPPPANDTCATPTEIPAGGGTFRGSLVDVADDVTTRCGGTAPDVLYTITLTEPRDLSVQATAASGYGVILSLVDRCTRSPMTLRCDASSPAQFNARNLPAGTYFIAVEGRNVPSFTLNVTTSAPTMPPVGDACANPFTVRVGETTSASLAGFESDYNLSCVAGSFRDAVHRLTLTERSDVFVTARGGASDYFFTSIQRTCGVSTSDVVCRSGTVGRLTARGLDPGDYFIVVKSLRGTDYTLAVDTRAPLPPTMVTGNDTCATAYAIPSGGGFFVGNTVDLRRDYAAPCSAGVTSEDGVFRFHADARVRAQFSLEGTSFDALIWVTTADRCPGSNIPGTCLAGSPGTPTIVDAVVDPGDYYVFVTGINSTARGTYQLTVNTGPAATTTDAGFDGGG